LKITDTRFDYQKELTSKYYYPQNLPFNFSYLDILKMIACNRKLNNSYNNNNTNVSCNKGKAVAEHGIKRYHAITAQVQATGGLRLGVNVNYLRIGNRHGGISRSHSLASQILNIRKLVIGLVHWLGQVP